MMERVEEAVRTLRLQDMVPYIGLGGASFYALMYWYFVTRGSVFSGLVLLLLLLTGLLGSYVTYAISCYMKELMLEGLGVTKYRIYHSVAFGRYVFALCLPAVALISALHFQLGLYVLGVALVAQRIAEIMALLSASHVTVIQSIVSALLPAIAMDVLFGIIVMLV